MYYHYPFAMPQASEEQPQQQYEPPVAPSLPGVDCTHCNEKIRANERGIELHLGVMKPGRKSGRLMVEAEGEEDKPAVLHEWCVQPFIFENVCNDLSFLHQVELDDDDVAMLGELFVIEDEERLCATCESKIFGDDEEEEEEDGR